MLQRMSSNQEASTSAPGAGAGPKWLGGTAGDLLEVPLGELRGDVVAGPGLTVFDLLAARQEHLLGLWHRRRHTA